MAPKVAQHRRTKGGKAPPAGKSTTGGKAKLKTSSLTKGKWMLTNATGAMLQHLVDTSYLPQPETVIPRLPVVELLDNNFRQNHAQARAIRMG